MKSFDIKGPQISYVNEDSDPIDLVLINHVDHPSILKIKEYFNEPAEFNFLEVIPNDIEKQIKNFDSSKNVRFKNITPKSLKKPPDICHSLL